MADNNTRDEFVFEDEVNQSEPEYTKGSYEGPTENIKSLLHNKRLMMLGGGVLALWVVTFLFDAMMPEDPLDKEVEAVEQMVDPAPMPVTVTPEPAPVSKPFEQSANFTDVENKVKSNSDGVEKISQNIEQQNSAIEKAHQNFNSLSAKVNKISVDVSDLHYQLNQFLAVDRELINKVNLIEDKMKKAEEAAIKKAEAKKVTKPLQTYFIRAVVEGRAWLVDKSGKSITVSVGDSLKDYGRINKIYSAQGFVVTSSGRVIEFPHDD